jgi:peptide/nickel transport system permease protein
LIAYLAKRILLAAAVMLTVSAIVFAVTNGAMDPARALAGADALPSDVAAIRHNYGLDRPLPLQFLIWLHAAVMGDFGHSYALHDQTVLSLIADSLPVTLTLAICALLLALLIAVPLGVVAALRPNSITDRVALLLAVSGQAMPSFWFALLLIVLFSVDLRWLPVSGSEDWRGFVLPVISLAYYVIPALMRLIRSAMIDVLEADYIRTAYAKGLRGHRILLRHALRNAMVPVVALIAVQFGFLLGGSVVIETVFALHGIGYLAWQSIGRGDLPVLQAIVLMASALYVVLTFLADLGAAALDPRIRLG